MSENVILICRAEERQDAENLVAMFPGGTGTFGVRLTVQNAIDPRTAIFYAGSGVMDSAMIEACRQSVRPMIKVFLNDGRPFDEIVATCKVNTPTAGLVGLRRCEDKIVVSRRQGELALYYKGVLDIVEAAVSQAPRDVQISYQRASEFRRDDQMLNLVCKTVLGWTDAQIDDLFEMAASIPN